MSVITLPTRSRDLRIVVLECPYDTWEGPFTREMFTKMVTLKLQGYASRYPYGVLPVDGSDLVSTHLMICEEKGGGLDPLLAYRSITDQRARMHAIKFPTLAVAESAGSEDHVEAFTRILADARAKNRIARYCSSYTIRPDMRDDKETAELLKIYMTGMHMLFHTHYRTGISMLAGVIRVRTVEYFSSWGYEPLTLDGRELPPLAYTSLFGEEALMMKLGAFSEHARDCAARTQDLWNRRITVQEAPRKEAERKAA